MNSDIDFGFVHLQNKQEKNRALNRLMLNISDTEEKISQKIRNNLNLLNVREESKIELSEIDKEINYHMHSLKGQTLSDEDYYYYQSTLDINNFFSGNK